MEQLESELDEESDIEEGSEAPSDELDDDTLGEFSPKSEFSKAQQVSEGVKKVIEARGKEMRDGYFNESVVGDNVIRTWIEDSRKVFISRVEALMGLMAPEMKNDEKFQVFYKGSKDKPNSVEKSFLKRKEALFNRYCYSERDKIQKDGKWFWAIKKDAYKWMPRIDEEVLDFDPQEPRVTILSKGGWNDKVNAYWEQLVPLYDELFAELNKLIDRLNYYKPKGGY